MMVRPNMWFMYDCHVFQKIDAENRAKAKAAIRKCFTEDPSGLLSLRWPDGSTGDQRPINPEPINLQLRANHEKNGWRVLDKEIDQFLDAFYLVKPCHPCRRKAA
jgi:hypothetical protein